MHALAATALIVIVTSGCSMHATEQAAEAGVRPGGGSGADAASSHAQGELQRSAEGRRLYVRCTGSGSPTVVMVGRDGEASSAHDFAVPALSAVTRTCVYDRALGRAGHRTTDMHRVLSAADPGPYVLVGRSEGGHAVTEYAYRHPEQVAGLVLIDTPCPSRRPDREIGDIPMTVLSVHHGDSAESAAERTNVVDQRAWLVLSPRSHQVIADTGEAIEQDDPELVIDEIEEVVVEAR